MMQGYLLVGGPRDGEQVMTTGTAVLVVAVMRPIEVFSKVTRFRAAAVSVTVNPDPEPSPEP